MSRQTPEPAGHHRPFNGIRFMIVNYLSGALIGLFVTVGFLALDIGHLRTLLLCAGMSLTFAGLYAAVTIMLTFNGRKDP